MMFIDIRRLSFYLFSLCFAWYMVTVVRCGCPEYDRDEMTCCRGRLHKGANQSCCSNEAYDVDEQTCCSNILHTGKNLSCCSVYAFDSNFHTCCSGSLFVGGGQQCENVTNNCDKNRVVVVGCYQYCSCADVLGGAMVPQQCGQMCEDCLGSRGEVIGCAPKCECDVNNGYVHETYNRLSPCIRMTKCLRRNSETYNNVTTTTTSHISNSTLSYSFPTRRRPSTYYPSRTVQAANNTSTLNVTDTVTSAISYSTVSYSKSPKRRLTTTYRSSQQVNDTSTRNVTDRSG